VDEEVLDFKKELQKTIKSVSDHMERLRFNVAISDMMKLMNFADKQEKINREDYFEFIKLTAPLIPHVADEILENFAVENS
jgi:leucyl-tRNA synthetase